MSRVLLTRRGILPPGQLIRITPMKATSIDDLSQELWRLIFRRVPHVSRLQCLCVSQKWYRFLKDLEDELKQANPVGSPQLLVLEKTGEEGENRLPWSALDKGLQWSALDTVSGEKTRMKLSWPPGWDPAVHGCIQGGGRSGLVALWDSKASQFWVGSPVHDKWEKVPGLSMLQVLPFHRQGFHFIPEGHRYKRHRFKMDPAVPCFPPVEKNPIEESGHYQIVQFQLNELHNRWPVHDRNYANWVIQVYSSQSRSWKILGEPKPAFRSLIHSSVSGRSVYFLAAGEPPLWDVEAYNMNLNCDLSVWVYRLDTGVLSCKVDKDFLNDEVDMYWRSMQLRVTKGGDFSIISVGHPVEDPDEFSLYELELVPEDGEPADTPWKIVSHLGLDELTLIDEYFYALIDSDSEDWGFNFIAFNTTEGYLDDLYGISHVERDSMYEKKEYLDRAAAEVSGFTCICYFCKKERCWKIWELACPLHYDGALPVVPFLPCCDLPCCT